MDLLQIRQEMFKCVHPVIPLIHRGRTDPLYRLKSRWKLDKLWITPPKIYSQRMWIWSKVGDPVGVSNLFLVKKKTCKLITGIYGVSGEFPLISIRFLAVPPSDYSGQPSKISNITYAAFKFQGNKGQPRITHKDPNHRKAPSPDIHPTLRKAEVDSLLASSAVLPPCHGGNSLSHCGHADKHLSI